MAADNMAFLDQLWRDWSPGYDAAADLARVKESLRESANLAAAIGYYRAATAGVAGDHAGPYAPEERAAWQRAERPTLYLHGSGDGCIGADLVVGAASMLPPGSRLLVIPDAGHFPQLEKPSEVNPRILAWVTSSGAA